MEVQEECIGVHKEFVASLVLEADFLAGFTKTDSSCTSIILNLTILIMRKRPKYP